MQRNPRSMRNLPIVAFRLDDAQRTACEALAAERGKTLNTLARDALLAEVAREMGVNTSAKRVNTPVRELTFVPDEPPRGEG